MKSTLLNTLFVVSLAAPSVWAGEAKVATITDEVSAVPGVTIVKDFFGKLPSENLPKRAIPQMPGFPTTMGSDGTFSPTRGLVFADLTGDGYLEIITSSTDRKIYAWDYTGTAVPGFPVTTIERAQYAPSVADMDGDGDIEIVQLTRGLTSGGRLYVLDHTGQILPGFPMSFGNNNLSSCPTLYDLDDDGVMEIIVSERDYPIALIHIVELDGTEWGGNWPVALDHVPTSTPAVGDVDNDGTVEIFCMSYDSMYLLAVDGNTMPGWKKQIPSANFSYQSAALADLDGDDDLEIVVGAHRDAAGCYVFHHDGTSYPGWPQYTGTWTYCAPTVTDLEGDGVLEILDGRAGFGPGMPSDCFWAWDSNGNVKPGFPYHSALGGGSEGPLTVADIDGDGKMEIFADYNIASDNKGYLFGVDSLGNDLPGFPLRPLGFTYMNGAAIADVDNDGDYELGVLSVLEFTVSVNLYDLPDMYAATCQDWTVYHAQNSRGGRYPTCSPCPADLTGDGVVNIDDIFAVLGLWGDCPDPCPPYCTGDLTEDCTVNIDDIFAILGMWGPCE